MHVEIYKNVNTQLPESWINTSVISRYNLFKGSRFTSYQAELCTTPVCPAFVDKRHNSTLVFQPWLWFGELFSLPYFSSLPSPSPLPTRLTECLTPFYRLCYRLDCLSFSASVSTYLSLTTNLSKPPHPAHTQIFPSHMFILRGWLTALEAGTMTEREGGEWEGPGRHREKGERERDWVGSELL